jgi:phosphate transport system substrate-binding protein
MRIWSLTAFLTCCSLACAFAGGDAEQDSAAGFRGDYVFGGSTTLLPLAEEAIEKFAQAHPQAKLSYEAPGSSAGVTGVLDRVYSLGGCSRELRPEEKARGARPYAVALDGIAIVVQGAVGIDNLSLEQVARIFTGQLRDWRDLGAKPGAIIVINRDEASGTRDAFQEIVLRAKLGRTAKFTPEAVIVESNGDMVTKVSSTPRSIGYCGLGFVEQARNAGAKELSVDKVFPTAATVTSRAYPISRFLYFVHRGELREGSLEKAFVDFLLSPPGQALVEYHGFIRLP